MELEAFRTQMNALPGVSPESTLAQVWEAEFKRAGLTTFGGVGRPLMESYEELRSRVEQAYTRPIGALVDEQNLSMATFDERVRTLNVLADQLPEEQRKELEPLKNVRLRAMQKAAKIERDANEIAGATYGFSGWATGLAAGLAANFTDPATVAIGLVSGGIGARAGMGIARTIVQEAVANAAGQALIEPSVQARRAELGLESGFTQGAINVLEAGVAGGGLAGLIKGGGYALRRLHQHWQRPVAAAAPTPTPEPATPPAITPEVQIEMPLAPAVAERASNLRRVGSELTPEDFEAIGNYVETRQIVVENTAPAGGGNLQLHEARINDGAKALEQARAPRPIETPAGTPANPLPFAPKYAPERVLAIEEPQLLIRPNGERMMVHPMVVELKDLTVSHTQQGDVNANYPQQLQPRERTGAASQTFIAEKAAALEPELLGRSPTAATGAPVIGPDGIVESGNGRVLMLERAYDRHAERAIAYRQFLERQGYDVAGFERPVLVRMREGDLPIEVRGRLAAEANVSEIAGLAPRERAFVDAKIFDRALLATYVPGDVQAAANTTFVREFANRAVAPSERPNFIDSNNRLSAEGARRVEAALVARAWGAPDIVSALYEAVDPTSRAVLGAFADTAPKVAQLRAAIEEGRVAAELDPTGHMLEALRLVDRARQSKLRVADIVYQVDIERGAVTPEVQEAVKLYFRDPETLRQAAGRDAVAAAIDKVVSRSLDTQNSVGDLFGVKYDALGTIREGVIAGSLELQELYGAGKVGLRRMIELKYDADTISQHPYVKASLEQAESLPKTNMIEGYGTPAWQAQRTFDFDGEIVTGYAGAIERLVAIAKKYGGGDTENNGLAILVIGPPAAGKSYFAETMARNFRAAIPDPDDAKKAIPQYLGGIGAAAVHEESSDIAKDVLGRLARERTNIVYPRVGDTVEKTTAIVERLRLFGYTDIRLVNVSVAPDEAFRRSTRRQLRTGRVVAWSYFENVDSKPDANYPILKAEGIFDEYLNIDANGPAGTEKILDGAQTEVATRGLGREGVGGPGRRLEVAEGARPVRPGEAPERIAAAGAEVARAPEPGRAVEAPAGEVPRGLARTPEGEQAMRILEREGDVQDLHIVDPETGEIRAVASARQELADADSQVLAAEELAGCFGTVPP